MTKNSDVPEPRHYLAFLSYSSKDEAVARKLLKRIEGFQIPKALVGTPGRDGPVPKRLFPLFRDREELPLSSNLGATIGDALKASRFLIVICSPHSAQSRWVNEEIRIFKAMGREDRVLAFIIDGVPNATAGNGDKSQECFPSALRFEVGDNGEESDRPCEPIAGDLRQGGDGWNNAVLKAVAGITGLGFDAFAHRERKRRRRRLAFQFIFFLVLIAGAFWKWDTSQVPPEPYQFYELHIPEGAEITESDPGGAITISDEKFSDFMDQVRGSEEVFFLRLYIPIAVEGDRPPSICVYSPELISSTTYTIDESTSFKTGFFRHQFDRFSNVDITSGFFQCFHNWSFSGTHSWQLNPVEPDAERATATYQVVNKN
ncbi:MAG: hypothetical protein ACI97A_002913 [Planctomycetota bacterium]|jgi:hypothetical protein